MWNSKMLMWLVTTTTTTMTRMVVMTDDGSVDCYDDVDDNLPAPDAPVGGPQGSPSLF